MRRAHLIVVKVDADLRPVVVVDHPADCLNVLEPAVVEYWAAGVFGVDTEVFIARSQIAIVYLCVMFLQFLEGVPDEVTGAAGVSAIFWKADDVTFVIERLDVASALPAAALPEGIGDFVGILTLCGVQIDVVGD